MSAPHFVVHDKTDSVGVVVVETVVPKTEMTGWVMETDETIKDHRPRHHSDRPQGGPGRHRQG